VTETSQQHPQERPRQHPPADRVETAGAAPEPADASRRNVLRAAGVGVVAALGAAGAAGTTRYRDVAAARGRGDAATVSTLSAATSLPVLWRVRTEQKVMALTFDDGPGAELTPTLLDILAAEKVRATFCLVGERAYELPELVRAQVRTGHELANHSWSHADLSLLGHEQLARDLERTDELLATLGGRRPAVIRPPYGRINGALLQHAAVAGQGVLLWDMRFLERELDTGGNAAYVLENVRPGTVLLAHDAGRSDRQIGIDAVPAVIRGAKERGYSFLTASEMFALDAGYGAKE
jgi:peptidoglycan/xylan/chitin deacetylase (PgdA/CDA1 family)